MLSSLLGLGNVETPIDRDINWVLFERHPLPMWIADAVTYRFLAVNDAAVGHYGYSREEFLSMTMMEVRPSEDVPVFREHLSGIPSNSGLRFGGTWRHRKKNGSIMIVEVTHNRIQHHGADAFLVVVHDITERKTFEEALLQSTRLEAIGRLSGGVAHDFNNVLTIILGYCNLTLDQMKQLDPLRPNIEGIRKAAERAARLTRQMLAFSRRQILQPKILDLNEIVTETATMLCRLIGEDVQLQTSLEPELRQVKADPGQIEQILINLTINARDAMPKGGTIVIETRNVVMNDSRQTGFSTGPCSYVLIAVSDTGVGMDSETIAHIFEPFFTTKRRDEGTGLGLATVYGIVKQSDGNISVYSEPGHGATFKVYLPAVDAAEQSRTKAIDEALPRKGSETILVVEDEPELRVLTRDVLKGSGYRVLEAANGEDALAVAARHIGAIQLMISDVVMPKLGGRECARRLTQVRPDMKVIFMSGYATDAVKQHGALEPNTTYIEKPFAVDVLLRKVREVLDTNRV